jgi:Invasin, domain 3/Bacterial Ig-like domain (group 3)
VLTLAASGVCGWPLVGTAQAAGLGSSITLQVSPGAIIANGASTTVATATVTNVLGFGVPGERIVFSSTDPGQTIGRVSDHLDGTYTATITSSTAPGVATITATDVSASIAAQATLSQTPNSSTARLRVLPSMTIVTNQAVTVLGTVSSTAGSPSGTVTFSANRSPIPGCATQTITPGSQVAVCQTSFKASRSPQRLAAVFTPDSSSTVAGSSAAATVSVKRDPTSTAVSASSFPAIVGRNVTYVAAPSASHQGAVEPSGSVAFQDHGKRIGSCAHRPLRRVGGSLAATCTVRYRKLAKHTITASYQGDSNFNGSASNRLTVPVLALGTLATTMQWSFQFSPAYTTVQALLVNATPRGATVTVRCAGAGCPFAKRAIVVGKINHCSRNPRNCRPARNSSVDLTPAFRTRRLGVGTRITVTITRPGWIGKQYLFVIRAGQTPRARVGCLAPGASRPGVSC